MVLAIAAGLSLLAVILGIDLLLAGFVQLWAALALPAGEPKNRLSWRMAAAARR